MVLWQFIMNTAYRISLLEQKSDDGFILLKIPQIFPSYSE